MISIKDAIEAGALLKSLGEGEKYDLLAQDYDRLLPLMEDCISAAKALPGVVASGMVAVGDDVAPAVEAISRTADRLAIYAVLLKNHPHTRLFAKHVAALVETTGDYLKDKKRARETYEEEVARTVIRLETYAEVTALLKLKPATAPELEKAPAPDRMIIRKPRQ